MFAGARLKQTHSCRKEGAVSIVCFEAGDGRLFYFRGRRGGLNYPPPIASRYCWMAPKKVVLWRSFDDFPPLCISYLCVRGGRYMHRGVWKEPLTGARFACCLRFSFFARRKLFARDSFIGHYSFCIYRLMFLVDKKCFLFCRCRLFWVRRQHTRARARLL